MQAPTFLIEYDYTQDRRQPHSFGVARLQRRFRAGSVEGSTTRQATGKNPALFAAIAGGRSAKLRSVRIASVVLARLRRGGGSFDTRIASYGVKSDCECHAPSQDVSRTFRALSRGLTGARPKPDSLQCVPGCDVLLVLELDSFQRGPLGSSAIVIEVSAIVRSTFSRLA